MVEGRGDRGYSGAVASQMAIIRKWDKLLWLERVIDEGRDDDINITHIKIRVPRHEGDEYMAVVRADQGGQPMVAFHAADGLADVLVGVANRYMNRTLKFREEKPYEG